jgi:hypothetical protein
MVSVEDGSIPRNMEIVISATGREGTENVSNFNFSFFLIFSLRIKSNPAQSLFGGLQNWFPAGLPDFSTFGTTYQHWKKIYQMAAKCTKWPQNVQFGH